MERIGSQHSSSASVSGFLLVSPKEPERIPWKTAVKSLLQVSYSEVWRYTHVGRFQHLRETKVCFLCVSLFWYTLGCRRRRRVGFSSAGSWPTSSTSSLQSICLQHSFNISNRLSLFSTPLSAFRSCLRKTIDSRSLLFPFRCFELVGFATDVFFLLCPIRQVASPLPYVLNSQL